MCTTRAALHHARVQQLRTGAPQVARRALVYFTIQSLCACRWSCHTIPFSSLEPTHRHCSPFEWTLGVGSYFEIQASALASGHAAVRYLLLGRWWNSRSHILQGPRRASVSPRFAPRHPPRQPFWTGALRAAASPPRPHASKPLTESPNP